jgi:RNA polymerase sigma factor (sigma-70 family)
MATNSSRAIIHHLRRAALLQDGAGMSDGQLLEAFLTRKDEAAFEALVRRHGSMVLGVCRRILGNAHDAEDAFQATFLVLIRKAATVIPQAQVGNWLYGVARTTALRAKIAGAKRRAKERHVAASPEHEAALPEDPWYELRLLLDEELSHLPDKYRLPIVLCDLENQPIKETARHLGWPQGTLAGRLARGRILLAKRLSRHGLKWSGGALAALISTNGASARVPSLLVSFTVKAASTLAARQVPPVAAISGSVAALMEGAVKSMFMNKVKVTTVTFLVVAAFGLGIIVYPAWTSAAEGQGIKPLPKPAAATRDEQKPSDVRVYEIEMRLLNRESASKVQTIAHPTVMVQEMAQATVEVHGQEELFRPDDSEEPEILSGEVSYRLRVKRLNANRVLLEISFQDTHIDAHGDDGCIVSGQTLRAFQKAQVGKKVELVVTKDNEGKPQRWLELMVRDVSAKEAAARGAPPVVVRPTSPRPVFPQPVPAPPAPRK